MTKLTVIWKGRAISKTDEDTGVPIFIYDAETWTIMTKDWWFETWAYTNRRLQRTNDSIQKGTRHTKDTIHLILPTNFQFFEHIVRKQDRSKISCRMRWRHIVEHVKWWVANFRHWRMQQWSIKNREAQSLTGCWSNDSRRLSNRKEINFRCKTPFYPLQRL